MSYDQLFYGGIILASLTFSALLFIWLKWDILQTMKDITGARGRKTSTTNLYFKNTYTSGRLKTVTSEIQLRPNEKNVAMNLTLGDTDSLEEQTTPTSKVMQNPMEETALLMDHETALLEDNETTLLDQNETTLLSANSETTLLHVEDYPDELWLEVDKNIVIIHAITIENEESETSEQFS